MLLLDFIISQECIIFVTVVDISNSCRKWKGKINRVHTTKAVNKLKGLTYNWLGDSGMTGRVQQTAGFIYFLLLAIFQSAYIRD